MLSVDQQQQLHPQQYHLNLPLHGQQLDDDGDDGQTNQEEEDFFSAVQFDTASCGSLSLAEDDCILYSMFFDDDNIML